MTQVLSELEKRARLRAAVVFTAIVFLVELAGGLLSGSLALVSDSVHVFLDLFALLISLLSIYLACLPTSEQRTYGWHRAEVLAALANALFLFGISGWIIYAATIRLREPVEVHGLLMMSVAVGGLVANCLVLFMLGPRHRHDINIRSAFLHVASDAVSSVGVVAAAGIIYLTGWEAADPIIALVIGLAVMAGSVKVLLDSVHILLEGVPRGLNLQEVVGAMRSVPGVKDVHHLHIWTICSNLLALSSHVLVYVESRERSDAIIAELERLLRERFVITETTFQMDYISRPGDTLVEGLAHPVDSNADH